MSECLVPSVKFCLLARAWKSLYDWAPHFLHCILALSPQPPQPDLFLHLRCFSNVPTPLLPRGSHALFPIQGWRPLGLRHQLLLCEGASTPSIDRNSPPHCPSQLPTCFLPHSPYFLPLPPFVSPCPLSPLLPRPVLLYR